MTAMNDLLNNLLVDEAYESYQEARLSGDTGRASHYYVKYLMLKGDI